MIKKVFPFWLIVFLAGVGAGAWTARSFFSDFAFAEPQHLKKIRAEHFELVDTAGRLRAKLLVTNDGEPTLVVYDMKEKPTAAYGLNGDSPVQNLLGRILKP
ncbi:MAG: hypothetical protein WAO55_07755 [Candidatus Manganitrophaceae bacterium]